MQNFNLESCGLVEMNDQEMTEIEGGIAPLIVIGCLLLLSGCIMLKPIAEHNNAGHNPANHYHHKDTSFVTTN